MKRIYYSACLTIIFFSLHIPLIAAEPPSIIYRGAEIRAGSRYEYRDTSAPSVDLEELSSRPTKINTVIEEQRKDSERQLYTLTDFHGVFPFPIEDIIPVFTEYDDEHEIYKRMLYTKDLNPETGPMEPHFQEVKTGFKFFGIGTEQHYILYKKPHRPSEDEFLLKWNLAKSVDGAFYIYYGSWYLRQLPPNSAHPEQSTYIRNFTSIGHADPPRGIKLAYKLFLSREIRGFFDNVYDAAEMNVKR